MKWSVLPALALLASTVAATPVDQAPNEKRQLLCLIRFTDIITDILLPGPSRQASSFCSEFGATTRTVTARTTATRGSTVISTVPVTATAVTTISAAAPTATQIVYENCGIVGYDAGVAAFRSDATANTFASCKGICQADENCESFAVSSTNCLLYRTPVLTNTNPIPGSPNTFYDRNCPASSQPAPAAVRRDAAVVARAIETPYFFERVPEPVLSSVCSCIVPRAPTRTSTVQQTAVVTRNVNSLVTRTVTTVFQTVGTAASQVTVTVTTQA